MNPLAKRTAKNSIYSTIAFLWPLALAFFATPFIVGKLGQTYYGLLAIVISFVSFFSVLDFGVAPSLVKHIAELETKKDFDSLSSIFSAALLFYFVVGLIGGILIGVLSPLYINAVIKDSNIPYQFVHSLFIIAGIGFFINMILSAFSSIPDAIQRFDITSRINLGMATFLTLGNVLLVAFGKGVLAIVVYNVLISIIGVVIYYFFDKKLLPSLRLTLKINKNSLKTIFNFGFFAFLATASGLVIAYLDRIILGAILGPTAVTYYVIPGNLTIKILNLVNAICAVVFPLTAALVAAGSLLELQHLYKRATRLIILLLTFLVVPAIIFTSKFLQYWLGVEYAQKSTVVMILLLITYTISALQVIPFGITLGSGKPKYGALYAMILAILNVAFMFLLIPKFNIEGAAAAYLIAVIIPTPIFVWYVEKKLVKDKSLAKFWLGMVPKVIILTIILAILCFASLIFIHSMLVLIIAYAAVVAITALVAIFTKLFNKEDIELLKKFLVKFGLIKTSKA